MSYILRIDPASPRYAEWMQTMGVEDLPIVAAAPTEVALREPDGHVIRARAYFIDVHALDCVARERLVQHIARQFGVHPGDVDVTLEDVGCPIRLDDDLKIVEVR